MSESLDLGQDFTNDNSPQRTAMLLQAMPSAPVTKAPTPARPMDPWESSDLLKKTKAVLVPGENASGDPNARNPYSSAGGMFQITDDTWLSEMQKHHPDMMQGKSSAEVLAMKFNGDLNSTVAAELALDNARGLQAARLPVTPSTLAAAHRLGLGGATAILKASPDTPLARVATNVMTPGNEDIAGLTVGQFLANPYPGGGGDARAKLARTATEGNEIVSNMLKQFDQDEARVKSLAKDYKPFDPPPPPKQPDTDPMQSFGGLASIFVALASLKSRTPGIAAMNGMASAINATKENDWKKFETSYKTWKDSTQFALETHRIQHEDMSQAMQMLTTNINAGHAMLSSVIAQTEDETMRPLLFQQQYGKIAEIQQEREKNAQQLAINALKADAVFKLKAAINARDAATKSGDPEQIRRAQENYDNAASDYRTAMNPYATGRGGAAAQSLQTYRDAIRNEHPDWRPDKVEDEAQHRLAASRKPPVDPNALLTDEQADFIAEQRLAGDKSALQNIGRGAQSSANLTKVHAAETRLARERGMSGADLAAIDADYAGLTASARTVGNVAGRVDIGARELETTIPQAREASDRVVRWGVVPIDRLRQALLGATNDPDLADFATANQSVANAFAQVMTRGGASTEGARNHAYDLLSTVRDKESYNRVLDRLQKEVQAVLDATNAARKDVVNKIMGRSETPSGGAQGSQPTDGQTSTSKSGKPIVYRNGQWEYQ